jgi:hypothetical protein
MIHLDHKTLPNAHFYFSLFIFLPENEKVTFGLLSLYMNLQLASSLTVEQFI